LRIIPSKLRYKSAPTVDQKVVFSLNQNNKQLEEYDRSVTVSLAQVFDDERQLSERFRPTFQINYLYDNTYIGRTNYKPFLDGLFYFEPEKSVTSNNWFGFPQFYEFDLFRPNINDGHFNYSAKSAFTYNWTYYITYPFENDPNYRLRTTVGTSQFVWTASDGIPFVIQKIQVNGNQLISFKCIAPHGLTVGESVELKMTNFSGYNGNFVFEVFSLGDGVTDSDTSVFNIYDIGYTGNTFSSNKRGTFKRVIFPEIANESTSKYYIRRNKVLLGVDDLILTRTGFQDNPFREEKAIFLSSITPNLQTKIAKKTNNYSYTLITKNDVILEGLFDNQKRPVSELFLTFVHKGYSGYFNKPFSNNVGLKQGWSFNVRSTNSNYWADNNFVSNSSIEVDSYNLTDINGVTKTFYYNKNLNIGDTIDGDFCEWNDYEQSERVVSSFYNKIKYNQDVFNTETTPTNNSEGFYYKSHNPMQLRVYSNFIESGDVNSVDLVPFYAFFSQSDQEFRWRDLYEYGYVDEQGRGVDYPFLNKSHYPFADITFKLIPEGSNINDFVNGINEPIKPIIDGCE